MDEAEVTTAARKYGTRVYQMPDGVVVVLQTVKSGPGQSDRYAIDGGRGQHVDPGDDAALGRVVRQALSGQL